ncbi:MAG TPA: uracil-DNA glycosylase family protein [Rhizomicrobium sp.]|jgi:uracil-DNA glycosylase|nr:uracil-DNA glycosylase family protein [Rhizomicrobium sp.]
MTATPRDLARLVAEIRACRICADILEPNPVVHVSATARLLIASQAPGLRVHATGISFNDASGDRLRDWMGVDRDTFYDGRRIAITAMAFCFPGYDESGSDLPPPKICAQHWRNRLMDALPPLKLILLVGAYAQTWHLGAAVKSNMTETVRAWRDYAPRCVPLPHPSWRNNGWLKQNPWFERELLPYLRTRVRRVLSS